MDKVLVVDDDLFTAELTAMFLEAAGFDTLIAEGGLDALERLADDSGIRLVVSDMNMPLMDGVQLYAELRDQGFTCPFVLISGAESAALRTEHPCIDAVLTKDEDLQEALPETVAALIAAAGNRALA